VNLRNYLSPILQPLIATGAEWQRPVSERKAKCEACIQARGPTAIYKDTLKCCTFFPFVPNFMIGAVLASDLPGRVWLETALRDETIERHQEEKEAARERRVSRDEAVVIPLGIGPSIVFQRRFKERQPDGYGNDESLLCPYYLKASGQCGIWGFRPSPCTSFYCESSYGIEGIEFWVRFEKWLSFVELSLAKEALLHLGFDAPEIALSTRFLPRYGEPDRHAPTGEKLRREVERSWLEFAAERSDFYRRTHAIVTSLTATDVKALLGEEGARQEAELLERASRLKPR
jgi:hypothetical protein